MASAATILEQALALDAAIIKGIESVNGVPLRVTTMTVCVSTSSSASTSSASTSIPLSYFIGAFNDPLIEDEKRRFFNDEDGHLELRATDGTTSRQFNNCLIFYHSCSGKKTKTAIKLFCNGTIHITGLATICATLRLAERFTALVAFLTAMPFVVKDFSIQLINAHFKLPTYLALAPMYNLMLQESEHLCRYNQEKHAGLIVQMLVPKEDGTELQKISVIVFESGNVLLSAFVTAAQMLEAYTFITEFIEKHPAVMRCMPEAKAASASASGNFDYSKFLILK